MKTLVIIALLPLARFGFPHREGQELEVEKKQAEEIIQAGFGKLAVDVKAEEEAKAKAAEEEAKAKAAEEAAAKTK
jgi:hypothetical protein